jgi:hypothetical protein
MLMQIGIMLRTSLTPVLFHPCLLSFLSFSFLLNFRQKLIKSSIKLNGSKIMPSQWQTYFFGNTKYKIAFLIKYCTLERNDIVTILCGKLLMACQ